MQHRGVVSPHGLIFFLISSLFILGLFADPTGAQTDDPIAGQTVFIEVDDGDNTVNAIGPIAVAGCTVARDAAIVVEDEGGTQAELVNGENATITGRPNEITIEGMGPNGTFPDLGLDPGQGRVVSSTGIVCGDSGGNGGTDGSCPGARAVETLTGTADDSTSEFNITGTSFRIRYDVTRLDSPPLTISALDENDSLVETLRVDQVGTGSFLVNQGPGRFVVEAAARGADYTITVEDCTQSGPRGDGANTGGNNTGNAAETQYATEGKEVTVIVETIPDKTILVKTGGPILPIIGGVILAIGLVGLGIFLLRRTWG